MSGDEPEYVELFRSGELARRVDRAVQSLADCALCGRRCGADRLNEEQPDSFCRTGRQARVTSFFPHQGEEDCLRGARGSGTIFFSHCNLRCVFCQNFDISWEGQGKETSPDELAEMMLSLQEGGCHNINFVTPSHVVPHILEALLLAAERGLNLPLVYNTGGYDRVETLKLLDGVVDIYMPDLKFSDPEVAEELANAADYWEIACDAVREMHRQVGDLVLDDRGVAQRGLLVRHLVMPNDMANTRAIMRFLAREISADTFVNIMPQYRPEGHAHDHEAVDRPLNLDEYYQAVAIARDEGLRRFDER